MIRSVILSAIVVLLSFSLRGQEIGERPVEEKVWTLEEVMEFALGNNSGLQRGELGLKGQQIDHQQALLNGLPAVSASVGHGISQGRSVDPTTNQFTESTFASGSQGLSADMMLFNGFRLLHDVRMKGQAREAGKLEFEGQVGEFKLDVIEAYIQVLTAADMLVQAENQLEVTREQLRRAETMHQEGAFAPGDYYDIRGQLKNDENYVATSKQNLYAARLRLARLMQLNEAQLGSLAPLTSRLSDYVDTEQERALFETAQKELPQFRALDFRIGESRQQIGVARSAFYPTLGLSAGMNSRFSDQYDGNYMTQFNQNLGKYVSVSLRIPIFNRLQTLNQVKQARLGYEDALLQKEIQLHLLKEETSKAVFDLKTTAATVRNLLEQISHYEESFRIAQVQFEAGNSNSFLFLTAKNKADAARQQLVIRQYEHLLQQYINDYYRGELAF